MKVTRQKSRRLFDKISNFKHNCSSLYATETCLNKARKQRRTILYFVTDIAQAKFVPVRGCLTKTLRVHLDH